MDADHSGANFICMTCGAQFATRDEPPATCPICADERQFVGHEGQRWTTMPALGAEHALTLSELEPGLHAIAMAPSFAIGQTALLVQSPSGNVLWDATPLVTEAAVATIERLGGIAAIAISHPHFNASMIEWSRAFDGAPVYVAAADRAWTMRPDRVIDYWTRERLELWDGLAVVRCGGHFDGSSVLHWPGGAGGRGALLVGDTIAVAADRRWVSFMRSFPNDIPLGPRALAGIEAALAPLAYDRIWSAWPGDVVASDAQDAVARSLARYRDAITNG